MPKMDDDEGGAVAVLKNLFHNFEIFYIIYKINLLCVNNLCDHNKRLFVKYS